MSRAELLLPIADDELVLGWRNSEWTGIALFLEEDVAFSSIAQNDRPRAGAVPARRRGGGRDRRRARVRPVAGGVPPLAARRVRLVPDWARTLARHVLYEAADADRLQALKASDDPDVAGLAAKIDREEAYHRLHAQMWQHRLAGERASPRHSTSFGPCSRSAAGPARSSARSGRR